MATGYLDAQIECPFYAYNSNNPDKIVCEGTKGADKVALQFKEREAKNKYIIANCVNQYKKCPIYRAVMEKYEEGGR